MFTSNSSLALDALTCPSAPDGRRARSAHHATGRIAALALAALAWTIAAALAAAPALAQQGGHGGGGGGGHGGGGGGGAGVSTGMLIAVGVSLVLVLGGIVVAILIDAGHSAPGTGRRRAKRKAYEEPKRSARPVDHRADVAARRGTVQARKSET